MFGLQRTSYLTATIARHIKPSIRTFSITPATQSRFTDFTNSLKSTVKTMTGAEVNAHINEDPSYGPRVDYHLIDIREPYEWNEEHIPGAVYLGRGVLERDLASIAKPTDTVVLYCQSGPRSLISADNLQRMGYKNVYIVEGGLARYKKQYGTQLNPKGMIEE
ncbi:hypothetical protein HK097_007675 [Rhizophlyctis rosea]|uniref:Rhodanese domain-containing protein n=1 Tax=Rhizophlyctis rosea TaxID=64517 RepID=A0AAD5X526_9FUNG|nr:hypothetical protein HK097_007675 [Rhizophlyctis rosea]